MAGVAGVIRGPGPEDYSARPGLCADNLVLFNGLGIGDSQSPKFAGSLGSLLNLPDIGFLVRRKAITYMWLKSCTLIALLPPPNHTRSPRFEILNRATRYTAQNGDGSAKD